MSSSSSSIVDNSTSSCLAARCCMVYYIPIATINSSYLVMLIDTEQCTTGISSSRGGERGGGRGDRERTAGVITVVCTTCFSWL